MIGRHRPHEVPGRVIRAARSHPVLAVAAATLTTVALLALAHRPARRHAEVRGAVSRTTSAASVTPVASAASGASASSHSLAGFIPTAKRARRTTRRHSTSRSQPMSELPLWPSSARRAAWRFFATYVPFTYGQLPSRGIVAASSSLVARLAANPPEVPAAMHRLHPHITALDMIPARIIDAGAGWAATATITDGIETYQMTVKLDQPHGRWLVTGLLGQ